MTEIIHNLYYMVDDWAGQQYENSEEAKALLARQSKLKEEIARRLGADGQELMDTLTNLNVSLEDIHDEALFRAAMRLGAQIAGPGSEAFHVKRPFYSTSL